MCAEKSLTFFRGISGPAARWEIPGSGGGAAGQAGRRGQGPPSMPRPAPMEMEEGPTGEEIDQHAGGSPGDEAKGNAQTEKTVLLFHGRPPDRPGSEFLETGEVGHDLLGADRIEGHLQQMVVAHGGDADDHSLAEHLMAHPVTRSKALGGKIGTRAPEKPRSVVFSGRWQRHRPWKPPGPGSDSPSHR